MSSAQLKTDYVRLSWDTHTVAASALVTHNPLAAKFRQEQGTEAILLVWFECPKILQQFLLVDFFMLGRF